MEFTKKCLQMMNNTLQYPVIKYKKGCSQSRLQPLLAKHITYPPGTSRRKT